MRKLLLTALLTIAATPAFAQAAAVEGSWGCVADIDQTRAGILTIFAGNYGYASANYKSTASGTGSLSMHTDGVQFVDGNLITNAGVVVGLLTFDTEGRDMLILQTSEKPILTCRPLF